MEGLLDSTSQYGGDAASLSNVAAGAAFSHGMMGLEGSLVPGGARQVPMEQSWAEMQDQDKHAFLIKNKLSRISQAGMDLRMLPQQSDDELLVVGLSVVELTRYFIQLLMLCARRSGSSVEFSVIVMSVCGHMRICEQMDPVIDYIWRLDGWLQKKAYQVFWHD